MAQWKGNECKNKNKNFKNSAFCCSFIIHGHSSSYLPIHNSVWIYSSTCAWCEMLVEFAAWRGVGTFILKSLSPNESSMKSRTHTERKCTDFRRDYMTCLVVVAHNTSYKIHNRSAQEKNVAHNTFNLIKWFFIWQISMKMTLSLEVKQKNPPYTHKRRNKTYDYIFVKSQHFKICWFGHFWLIKRNKSSPLVSSPFHFTRSGLAWLGLAWLGTTCKVNV